MRDLSAESGVALQTVQRFESGDDLKDDTIARMADAFKGAGLRLIDADRSGGEGLRFAKAEKRRQ